MAGLRERKKRETRIALSWATIRLAAERGLDNVRVEDIAAEVGVSPRTFNNYFSSKAEAVAARHLERMRSIAVELVARPAGEPLWEAITEAALSRFALGARADELGLPDEQWVAGIRVMVAEPALQGELVKADAKAEAELAAAVAARTGTDADRDLYPLLVAGAVGAAVRAAIVQHLRSPASGPFPSLLRDALQRMAAGLRAP